MYTTPRLLTARETAAVLRLSATRVLRLARAGELPHVALPTGEIVFDLKDLARWIAAHKWASGESEVTHEP